MNNTFMGFQMLKKHENITKALFSQGNFRGMEKEGEKIIFVGVWLKRRKEGNLVE